MTTLSTHLRTVAMAAQRTAEQTESAAKIGLTERVKATAKDFVGRTSTGDILNLAREAAELGCIGIQIGYLDRNLESTMVRFTSGVWGIPSKEGAESIKLRHQDTLRSYEVEPQVNPSGPGALTPVEYVRALEAGFNSWI
jgi:hypothetical protein